MGGEWQTVPLDSLIEPSRGISYGIVQPGAPVADGVPIVRVSDVRDGRVAVSSPLRVAPAIEAAYARTRLTGGELLLTLVGTVGEAAIAPASLAGWNTARAVAVIPVRKEIGAYWVKLALQAPGVREIIDSRLNTTVQATLNLGDVAKLPIVMPPSGERKAIAHILGTLDDKIELNRRMNETLEAMARALFKSWFVDFDPVRAKMGAAPHPKSLSRGERDFLPSPPGRGAGGEGTQPAIRANAPIPTQFLDFARQLRRQATDAENLLWRLLRGRQIANAKFRRQYSFPPYILDFYCHELKLAVELDGGQHNEEVGRRRDARRDEYLAGHGIRVLRFWNNDVLRETEAVLEAIYAAVVERSGGVPSPPAPLPGGEGSCGLPKPLADLFPDSFEDSELGEIPRGWKMVPLPQLIEVNPTRPLRKGEVAPYLDMANMPTRGHSPDVVFDRPFGSGMRFINGDTLVARITPCLENGKTAYVDFLEDGRVGWGSTEFIILRPKPPLPSEFAYCLARSEGFRDFAIQSMTGSSGRQRVPAESLSHYLLATAPPQIVERFGVIVRPLFARASAAAKESRTLAALRDTLLPKLISGELRIQHADKFLETVA